MTQSLALLCTLGVVAAVADIYPAGIPNVWGGLASAPAGGVLGGCSGHLFGYSGLDGNTSESADFTGVFEAEPYTLRFCGLKQPVVLKVDPQAATPGSVLVATNDALVVQTATSGPAGSAEYLKMAWASTAQLLGSAPPGSDLNLGASATWPHQTPSGFSCNTTGAGPVVALCWAPTVDAMSFAVGYAATAPAAVAIAANGTLSSVDEAVQRRLVQYAHLPPLTNSSRLRLFSKAISVM